MRTPEKIRKGLECCKNGECEDCRYLVGSGSWSCVGRLIKDVFAYVQQLEAQQPRWISVKERLPGNLEKCLTYSKANGFKIGCYTEVGFIMTAGYCEEPTHWMPLPLPPVLLDKGGE